MIDLSRPHFASALCSSCMGTTDLMELRIGLAEDNSRTVITLCHFCRNTLEWELGQAREPTRCGEKYPDASDNWQVCKRPKGHQPGKHR